MKATTVSIVVLTVTLALLGAGLSKLIHLRFETGDSYPVGSSLRPDPLGTKVLFESFAALPDLAVERNFTPLNEWKDISPNATLLMANTWGWSMYELAEYESIREFVRSGGRLVIAMNTDRVAYRYLEGEEEDNKEEDTKQPEGSASDDAVDSEENEVADDEELAFRRKAKSDQKEFWGELSLIHGKRNEYSAQLSGPSFSTLPVELPWRKGGALEGLGDLWLPVYEVEEEVVAAERRYGEGSIAVLTDDYLLSNEGLLKHRFSGLLIWVIGSNKTLIFDETHLGVSETTGIAKLIRRYRLSGFFVALFALWLLVVWRGASPLLPPFANRTGEDVILADHSSEAGLADLVRRSVPLSKMPAEAFRKWKATFIKTETDRRYYAAELEEAETILSEQAAASALRTHPLQTHLRIKSIINRKKRKRL